MISLPSVETLWVETTATFRRFPLVLLLTVLTTFFAIALSENSYDNANQWMLTRLLMSSGLATLLCLSVTLMTEKYRWGYYRGLLYQLLAIGVVAIYYWLDTRVENQTTFIRFGLLVIFVHLWVAIAPYVVSDAKNGFWQYNQRLFIRFLIAVLYTGVLYLGLALAIQAIKTLFNAEIGDRIFSRLFIFLIGIFNTWFFLAGIPRDFEALENDENYPKGLKLFTQYVLLPLVVIYFVILYAYSAKILIEWNLPKGWVSWLVLCLSVAGIFSLLLIEPIKDKEENKWIKQFSKVFYFAIFPLIGLLIVSIWKRVSDYGITEPRYFVVVLALWLTGISLYFLFSKEKNIRYIPISLAVVALFSAYSPWNAFVVSSNSQYNRFVKIAQEQGLLQNGKFQGKTQQIPFAASEELMSILNYFDRNHDLRKFQPLYYTSIDSLFKVYESKKLFSSDSLYLVSPKEKLAEIGGFYQLQNGQVQKDSEGNYVLYRYFYLKNSLESFDVAGFDYMYKISVYNTNYADYVSSAGNTKLKLDSVRVNIQSDNQLHVLSLEPFIQELTQQVSAETYEYLPLEKMTFEVSNEKFRLRLYSTYLVLAISPRKNTFIRDIDGWLLLEKIKK